MKKIGSISLCVFLSGALCAQVNQAFLDQLSVDNGLSQSEVLCVLKDRQGYVWMGTQDGLNRYDGYSFTYFKNNPFDASTLSSDQIYSLLEDAGGTIWVGTGNGLNRYEAASGRFVRYPDSSASTRNFSITRINALCTDRQGVV